MSTLTLCLVSDLPLPILPCFQPLWWPAPPSSSCVTPVSQCFPRACILSAFPSFCASLSWQCSSNPQGEFLLWFELTCFSVFGQCLCPPVWMLLLPRCLPVHWILLVLKGCAVPTDLCVDLHYCSRIWQTGLEAVSTKWPSIEIFVKLERFWLIGICLIWRIHVVWLTMFEGYSYSNVHMRYNSYLFYCGLYKHGWLDWFIFVLSTH